MKQPKPMGRVHLHHEVEINYVFAGQLCYLQRGHKQTIKAGQLAVFWGTPPHSLIEVARGTEMAWITVPLGALLTWGLPQNGVRAVLNGTWLVVSGKRAARYPLREWVQELAKGKRGSAEALLLEVRACLLRILSEIPAQIRTRKNRTARTEKISAVETMAQFLGTNYREPVSVAEVAKAAGIHPNYAMTTFQNVCGITIRDYLLQHRLAHAQQLLITTNAKVLDVAMESGFGSQSAFYSAFVAATKQTPLDYRRQFFRSKH